MPAVKKRPASAATARQTTKKKQVSCLRHSKVVRQAMKATKKSPKPAATAMLSAVATNEKLNRSKAYRPGFRAFDVQTMGGEQFGVSVPLGSTVGDLLEKISKEKGLGFCFSLISNGGQVLSDPACPVPEDNKLQCVVENLSELCEEAQQILKSIPFTVPKVPQSAHNLRLGPCRFLGSFPYSKWREIEKEDMLSDIEADYADNDYTTGKEKPLERRVHELSLIDGDNNHIRLIGVIRPGYVGQNARISYNSGMVGPIYLRPGFQQVGKIQHTSEESCGSEWILDEDISWYKEPQSGLPHSPCEEEDYGGSEMATTTLQMHLALALRYAEEDKSTQHSRREL